MVRPFPRKFHHPISSVSTSRIEESRLEFLVGKLRDRSINKDEKEELTRGFLRLVLGLVREYLGYAPYKRDVLVAEALYGLALAIDQAPDKLVNNRFDKFCTGYIRMSILNALFRDSGRKMKREPLSPDITSDKDSGNWVLETVESVVKSETERKIVNMKLEGYTAREIAEELGVTPTRIGQILSSIEGRFWDEHRDQ